MPNTECQFERWYEITDAGFSKTLVTHCTIFLLCTWGLIVDTVHGRPPLADMKKNKERLDELILSTVKREIANEAEELQSGSQQDGMPQLHVPTPAVSDLEYIKSYCIL